MVREIKMLKAVLISCPRKFIINNHILFFLLIVHYTRLHFFLFCDSVCVWLTFFHFASSSLDFSLLFVSHFFVHHQKITALAPQIPDITQENSTTSLSLSLQPLPCFHFFFAKEVPKSTKLIKQVSTKAYIRLLLFYIVCSFTRACLFFLYYFCMYFEFP